MTPSMALEKAIGQLLQDNPNGDISFEEAADLVIDIQGGDVRHYERGAYREKMMRGARDKLRYISKPVEADPQLSMLGDFNGRYVSIQSECGSSVSHVINNLRWVELKDLYDRRHGYHLRSRREDEALKGLIDKVEPLMTRDEMLTFEEAIRAIAGGES